MNDQQVMAAIRRRMTSIEHELLVDPPVTPEQFVTCMAEYADETVRLFAPKPESSEPVPAPDPQVASARDAKESLEKLAKTTAELATKPAVSAERPVPVAEPTAAVPRQR